MGVLDELEKRKKQIGRQQFEKARDFATPKSNLTVKGVTKNVYDFAKGAASEVRDWAGGQFGKALGGSFAAKQEAKTNQRIQAQQAAQDKIIMDRVKQARQAGNQKEAQRLLGIMNNPTLKVNTDYKATVNRYKQGQRDAVIGGAKAALTAATLPSTLLGTSAVSGVAKGTGTLAKAGLSTKSLVNAASGASIGTLGDVISQKLTTGKIDWNQAGRRAGESLALEGVTRPIYNKTGQIAGRLVNGKTGQALAKIGQTATPKLSELVAKGAARGAIGGALAAPVTSAIHTGLQTAQKADFDPSKSIIDNAKSVGSTFAHDYLKDLPGQALSGAAMGGVFGAIGGYGDYKQAQEAIATQMKAGEATPMIKMAMRKKALETLGIDENASPETIKKAYNQLAMKYHPDKQGGSEIMMRQINQAYDFLTNGKLMDPGAFVQSPVSTSNQQQFLPEQSGDKLAQDIISQINQDKPQLPGNVIEKYPDQSLTLSTLQNAFKQYGGDFYDHLSTKQQQFYDNLLENQPKDINDTYLDPVTGERWIDHSIYRDSQGRPAVEIDERYLEGKDPGEYRDLIKNKVMEKFAGKTYSVGGGDQQALVGRNTAGKLAVPSNRNQTQDNYRNKGESAGNLDEIIESLHNVRIEQNLKSDTHSNVDKYIKGEVEVKIGNETFYPTMSFRVYKDGSIVAHDLVFGETGPGLTPGWLGAATSVFPRNSRSVELDKVNNGIIPQTVRSVNSQNVNNTPNNNQNLGLNDLVNQIITSPAYQENSQTLYQDPTDLQGDILTIQAKYARYGQDFADHLTPEEAALYDDLLQASPKDASDTYLDPITGERWIDASKRDTEDYWAKLADKLLPQYSPEARQEIAQAAYAMRNDYGNGASTALVTDETSNNVVNRLTSSNNAPWYQEYYRRNGRAPSDRQLIEVADEMMMTGEYGAPLSEKSQYEMQKFAKYGGSYELDENGDFRWVNQGNVPIAYMFDNHGISIGVYNQVPKGWHVGTDSKIAPIGYTAVYSNDSNRRGLVRNEDVENTLKQAPQSVITQTAENNLKIVDPAIIEQRKQMGQDFTNRLKENTIPLQPIDRVQQKIGYKDVEKMSKDNVYQIGKEIVSDMMNKNITDIQGNTVYLDPGTDTIDNYTLHFLAGRDKKTKKINPPEMIRNNRLLSLSLTEETIKNPLVITRQVDDPSHNGRKLYFGIYQTPKGIIANEVIVGTKPDEEGRIITQFVTMGDGKRKSTVYSELRKRIREADGIEYSVDLSGHSRSTTVPDSSLTSVGLPIVGDGSIPQPAQNVNSQNVNNESIKIASPSITIADPNKSPDDNEWASILNTEQPENGPQKSTAAGVLDPIRPEYIGGDNVNEEINERLNYYDREMDNWIEKANHELKKRSDPVKNLLPEHWAIFDRDIARRMESNSEAAFLAKKFNRLYGYPDSKDLEGLSFMEKLKHRKDYAGQMGWKLTRYIEDPTLETATRLGLDNPEQYDQANQELRYYLDNRTKQVKDITGKKYGRIKDNYITHLWANSPEEVEEVTKSIGVWQPFMNKRVIPSYEAGVAAGLTPKYSNPASILAVYHQMSADAINNHLLIQDLLAEGLIEPEVNKRSGWVPVDAPSLNQELGQQMYAPKDVAKVLSNLYGEGAKGNKYIGAVAEFAGTLQDLKLSGGIPLVPANSFTYGQMIQDIAGGNWQVFPSFAISLRKEWSQNFMERHQESVKELNRYGGQMINSTFDHKKELANYFKQKINDMVDDGTIKGKIKKGFNKYIEAIDEFFGSPTFDRYLSIMQIWKYESDKKYWMKRGKSNEEAAKQAAKELVEWYGSDTHYSRSKLAKQIQKAVRFAPLFRETTWHRWFNYVRSFYKDKDITSIFKPENRQWLRFTIGAATMLALYEYFNVKSSGHHMWQNKEGKQLSTEIVEKDKNGNPTGRAHYVPFMHSSYTEQRHTQQLISAIANGDEEQIKRELLTFASLPLQEMYYIITNQDYSGKEIRDTDASAVAQMYQMMTYMMKETLHPWIAEPLDYLAHKDDANLRTRKTKEEMLMNMFELPQYTSLSTDVTGLSKKQLETYDQIRQTGQDPSNYAKTIKETKKLQESAKQKAKSDYGQSSDSGASDSWFSKIFGAKSVRADSGEMSLEEIAARKSYVSELLKSGQGSIVSQDDLDLYYLTDIVNLPADTRLQKAQRNTKLYKLYDKIEDDEALTTEQKQHLQEKILSETGMTSDQMVYYRKASAGNDNLKFLIILDDIESLGIDTTTNEGHDQLLDYLIEARKSVGGKILAAVGVITELQKRGLITKSEAKILKNLDWDEELGDWKNVSTLTGTGGGSGGSSSKSKSKTPEIVTDQATVNLAKNLRNLSMSSSRSRSSVPAYKITMPKLTNSTNSIRIASTPSLTIGKPQADPDSIIRIVG